MLSRLWTIHIYLFFFWSFRSIEANDEFCDSFFPSIYCSCDLKYMHTTMTCFITQDMQKDSNLWRDMSSVDNVVILKLHCREPFKLSEIPIESLQLMQYLESLSVSQGNLTDLKPYAVSGLKVLRELELNDCEITSLQKNAITDLPKLKLLSLRDNLLQEIPDDSLSGLLDLEKLFLENNNISRIEPCAFCDLQNLRDLSLFSNEITDLTEYMFRGLKFLNNLDLSKNKIRILNDKVFHSMERLVDLDLKDNLIYHIGPRTFQGLKKLRTLNLKSNKIKTLPDEIFSSLPSLRSVDLDRNELQTLQPQVLENMDKFDDTHFYIAIKSNPLTCDCRLSWVSKYLQFNHSHTFTSELMQLQCTTDGEIPNQELVHGLDMNCSHFVEQQKNIITTSRSVDDKLSDLVAPYEIQKRKNKFMPTDSIVGDDDVVSQDSEMIENVDDEVDSGPSGARGINADLHMNLCVVLLTLLLVRKRKGTWF